MSMRVFSARVRNGTIVPDEAELAEAIAEADRGDIISAAELLRRLSR
jgi:hypothetical protein